MMTRKSFLVVVSLYGFWDGFEDNPLLQLFLKRPLVSSFVKKRILTNPEPFPSLPNIFIKDRFAYKSFIFDDEIPNLKNCNSRNMAKVQKGAPPASALAWLWFCNTITLKRDAVEL